MRDQPAGYGPGPGPLDVHDRDASVPMRARTIRGDPDHDCLSPLRPERLGQSPLRAGQVRPLCVFDRERISYTTRVTGTKSWNDIPTCREEGLDIQYLMLRAMFLPGKVTEEQKAFYVNLFQKVTQPPEYRDYMEEQALKPIFLTGKDMLKFLEEDDALNRSLMMEAGFVAK